jgi:Beta propeller domain
MKAQGFFAPSGSTPGLPTPARRARAAGVLAALALVLSACGGGSGAEPEPQGNKQQALAASQPGELALWAQARLKARHQEGKLAASPGADWMAVGVAGAPTTASAAPRLDSAAPRSGTLVQEAGVDEADLLLSDGARLFTLQPGAGTLWSLKLHTRDAQGIARVASEVAIADAGASDHVGKGLYLAEDTRSLAVLSQSWYMVPMPRSSTPPVPSPSTPAPGIGCAATVCDSSVPYWGGGWMRSRVGVQRVDVGNASSAAAGERITIEGHLVDSRRIGDTLYLVTQYTPELPAFSLPTSASDAEREAAIARTQAGDLLPTLRRNGGPAEPLLADTDCYVQPGNASTSIVVTTVTMIDMKSPSLAHRSRCFAGGSEALYMSTGALYVATTRWSYADAPNLDWRYPLDIMTDIHKFALQDGGIVYKGSGAVNGHLGWDAERKSLRMSEYKGDLRVLSFTGDTGWFTIQDAGNPSRPASPARLTVLRERSSDLTLQAVATLPNANRPAHIGKPGEQVYGVRFVGERAYVVTFRRTDPLYVLDLADPQDPKAVGELETAGFSEHLFPLDNGLLLGVGRNADSTGRVDALKVALFDVADPTRPRELGDVKLGGFASQMTLDLSRHGLNLLMKDGVARVALPVNLISTNLQSSTAALQRFEVDTRARSLRSLPMHGADSSGRRYGTWLERSLQIGDQVYYLNQASISTFAW